MKEKQFDPNGIGIKNGNYFGFPYKTEEADLILVSAPWDVTTSYSAGTAEGPNAILEASTQLDFYDFDIEQAWKLKIGTLPIDNQILSQSKEYRQKAKHIIDQLEEGKSTTEPDILEATKEINEICAAQNKNIYNTCKSILKQDKFIGLIGGDHSVPLGYLKALSEKYDDFGILHIDAHADLRKAYEGFKYSHASIMYNALQLKSVSKIVQVGIRDVCDEEIKLYHSSHSISMFDDNKIKDRQYNGSNWISICKDITGQLPNKVYISFDIDGLSPDNCPNTGTPVPGGLSFSEATYLLKTLYQSGKEIIGFDLCEVCPSSDPSDEWDANVGARILLKLSYLLLGQKR